MQKDKQIPETSHSIISTIIQKPDKKDNKTKICGNKAFWRLHKITLLKEKIYEEETWQKLLCQFKILSTVN